MIRRRGNLLLAAGSLVLAVVLSLRLWTHANHAHFASGFFVGVFLALLISGLSKPSRADSK